MSTLCADENRSNFQSVRKTSGIIQVLITLVVPAREFCDPRVPLDVSEKAGSSLRWDPCSVFVEQDPDRKLVTALRRALERRTACTVCSISCLLAEDRCFSLVIIFHGAFWLARLDVRCRIDQASH